MGLSETQIRQALAEAANLGVIRWAKEDGKAGIFACLVENWTLAKLKPRDPRTRSEGKAKVVDIATRERKHVNPATPTEECASPQSSKFFAPVRLGATQLFRGSAAGTGSFSAARPQLHVLATL
jgi:hypothetical protein